MPSVPIRKLEQAVLARVEADEGPDAAGTEAALEDRADPARW